MSHLELTRDLLMDAGGHVEMKKARAIHREGGVKSAEYKDCLLYTSPSPRDQRGSRMPSSA